MNNKEKKIPNIKNLLVVDDDQRIRDLLKEYLVKEGFLITTADCAENAREKIKYVNYDLIILDVMMPDLDGIETCERLRQDERFQETIIMFLTARGEDYSYVAAFDAGADDYVTKPVKPKVLVSKVKGLLRRLKKREATSTQLEFKNLMIDREEYKVTLKGKELSMPKKEFELLYLLASKPGKVFKREKIMEKIWGSDVVVGDRTIDVHIRKLREKIGNRFFKTVKGVGYKFIQPEK